MRRAGSITVAVLATFAVGSPARAATVTASALVLDDGKSAPRTLGTSLTVTAAPGETNTMSITAAADALTILDTTAPPTAARGCEQNGADEVRCPRQGVRGAPDRVSVSLDDGDDTLDTTALPVVSALLGDGDDRVRLGPLENQVQGGAGNDTIEGGAGYDLIEAGPGFDTVTGGAGNDLLDGGDDTDHDLLDGGPGTDIATSAQARLLPRLVDLSLGAGYRGDELRSIETAWGAEGDDMLLGSNGPDTLSGQGSRAGDVLDGRGGDDVLVGAGPGRDRLTGGAGDDELDVVVMRVTIAIPTVGANNPRKTRSSIPPRPSAIHPKYVHRLSRENAISIDTAAQSL